MNQHLIYFMAAVATVLICGSMIRLVALRSAETEVRVSRLQSLRTWWILFVVVAGAALAGQAGVLVLLLIAGTVGLREYLGLIGYNRLGILAAVAVFAMLALHYGLIASGYIRDAQMVTPVAAVLLICTARVLSGDTTEYIRTTGAAVWGVLLFGYNISHAAIISAEGSSPWVGQLGWFLFVSVLTEINDISQAICGRRIGKHKITPTVSPNKSWEGFLAGVIVTSLAANVMAPWLTTFYSGSDILQNVVVTSIAGTPDIHQWVSGRYQYVRYKTGCWCQGRKSAFTRAGRHDRSDRQPDIHRSGFLLLRSVDFVNLVTISVHSTPQRKLTDDLSCR